MSRRTMFAPIRPRPIIPICMCSGYQGASEEPSLPQHLNADHRRGPIGGLLIGIDFTDGAISTPVISVTGYIASAANRVLPASAANAAPEICDRNIRRDEQ